MGKGKEVRERHGNLTAFNEYGSKSVLGQIYKLVDPEGQDNKIEKVVFDEELTLEWAGDALPVMSRWNSLLSQYKEDVRKAMSGPRTEFRDTEMERVKLKYKAVLWARHLSSDAAAAAADGDAAAAKAVAAAIEELEEKKESPPADVILAARAAYSVTYAEANTIFERGYEKHNQAVTFPWNVAGPVLCKIKLAAVKRDNPHYIEMLSCFGIMQALCSRKRKPKGPVELDLDEEAMDLS